MRHAYESGMIVSTTSSLEGWRIDHYLGPVSVHLVAGTNLFSDFFASWSDVFGGRSHTYGRQLAGLYQEAVGMLVEEARKRGATAVVAVKMDFDEVGAQGKSMFMVNVVGTAVRAVRLAPPTGAAPPEPAGVVPAEEMAVQVRKNQVLRAIAARQLKLDRDTWEFITEHRVAEAAGFVLGAFLDAVTAEEQAAVEERARLFFGRLPPERARAPLYRALEHTSHPGSGRLHRLALVLIRDLRLLDFPEILRLLWHEDRDVRVRAVGVLDADRPVYEAADVASLEELRELLPRALPPLRQAVKERTLLGGERDALHCQCGKRIPPDEMYCTGCERDAHGFRRGQGSLPWALSAIDARLEVLRALLGPTPSTPPSDARVALGA